MDPKGLDSMQYSQHSHRRQRTHPDRRFWRGSGCNLAPLWWRRRHVLLFRWLRCQSVTYKNACLIHFWDLEGNTVKSRGFLTLSAWLQLWANHHERCCFTQIKSVSALWFPSLAALLLCPFTSKTHKAQTWLIGDALRLVCQEAVSIWERRGWYSLHYSASRVETSP